jgi:hypothetical protein
MDVRIGANQPKQPTAVRTLSCDHQVNITERLNSLNHLGDVLVREQPSDAEQEWSLDSRNRLCCTGWQHRRWWRQNFSVNPISLADGPPDNRRIDKIPIGAERLSAIPGAKSSAEDSNRGGGRRPPDLLPGA